MFAVLITALLCLVAVGHSDPVPCEDLLRPLDPVVPSEFEGQWAFIAGSLNDSRAEVALKGRDSVAIYFHNVENSTSYTRINRNGQDCEYHRRVVSMENNRMKLNVGVFNFTGTFYQSSCKECVLLTMEIESATYHTLDSYLISKSRRVENKVLEEFKAQVECLHLPPPIVMDPTKELCPEQQDDA